MVCIHAADSFAFTAISAVCTDHRTTAAIIAASLTEIGTFITGITIGA
jgi:hypothetical protein